MYLIHFPINVLNKCIKGGGLRAGPKKNDKELMIPLVDEFLVEVKRKEKKLIFNLPEGITEL